MAEDVKSMRISRMPLRVVLRVWRAPTWLDVSVVVVVDVIGPVNVAVHGNGNDTVDVIGRPLTI